jgi:hypothetical protein
MVGRENSEKFGAGTVSQQVLQRRLDVDPGCNRKLASCRRDLVSLHAEVLEQDLAEARRPSKASVADRKGKSHAAFMVDFSGPASPLGPCSCSPKGPLTSGHVYSSLLTYSLSCVCG